jgi:hypothetical protein
MIATPVDCPFATDKPSGPAWQVFCVVGSTHHWPIEKTTLPFGFSSVLIRAVGFAFLVSQGGLYPPCDAEF